MAADADERKGWQVALDNCDERYHALVLQLLTVKARAGATGEELKVVADEIIPPPARYDADATTIEQWGENW